MFEQLLPPIHAKDKSPPASKRKPKKGKGYDPSTPPRPSKYNHKQMLQDRIAGMSWHEIAVKHGVRPSGKRTPGEHAQVMCVFSRAGHALTPEQVAKLGSGTL